MRDVILRYFEPETHPLTLVSDPDGVLADEKVATALDGRRFRIVGDTDPVLLRLHVERARPWTVERPLIIVTTGPLKELPYDLWQQGHRVTLSLDVFFANLVTPVVRELTSEQRERLSKAPAPVEPLGRQATVLHVLRHVFGTDLDELRQPGTLIAWLNDLHARAEPLPSSVAAYVIASLRAVPAYAEWPLEELLGSDEAFAAFVREQWRGYVQEKTGRLLAEEPVGFVLDFETDTGLQDDLARLVRTGAVAPVGVAEPERLPAWARAGVLGEGEDGQRRRMAELADELFEHLRPEVTWARWSEWQAIARAWAELSAHMFARSRGDGGSQDEPYAELRKLIDAAFWVWFRASYAPLGGQVLPTPHHLHHVPHYLAYERRQRRADRMALLILDGMSLADWCAIGATWRARRPGWMLQEQLVLAQMPTITVISRLALVSGLRPADFGTTIGTTAAEPALWRGFWAREDVPAAACEYVRLALDREEMPALPLSTVRALCLVDYSIDEIIHGASLGAADVSASLWVWLEQISPRLEALVDRLLASGFAVYVASDHGHVEARGIGQPSEGLAVETRGRRARVYRDEHLAESVRSAYDDAEVWSQDGVLPDDVWVVLAPDRTAFAPSDDTIVTHGGRTIDEVVVPFVTIRSR
jgi:PglZ domain